MLGSEFKVSLGYSIPCLKKKSKKGGKKKGRKGRKKEGGVRRKGEKRRHKARDWNDDSELKSTG